MGKRAIAAGAAVLLGCGLLSSCHSGATGTHATEPAAQSSDTAAATEARAVQALRTWLDDPVAGTLTISSVETSAATKSEVSRQLTGRADPLAGTASLTGTLNVLGGRSTVQDPLSVIEKDGELYSSIPTRQL